jgi:molybdopterin synthase catalytic subunit
MQIKVLFFGRLKDCVQRASDLLNLPANSSLQDVIHHYESVNPELKQFFRSIAISVNQEYAAADTPLKDGDEVGLLPPVSGGSQSTKLAAIVRGKIDTQEVLSNMKNRSDGAVVIFEGIVRGHTRGRSTLYLEYEAYEEMALKQMESLRAQARADFKIREARIVHRLGRLEIGETSVLTVVASEHRAAAFDACRWLIDTLKKTVPIWKKEYFEEGAVWADGEPFPDEITPGKGTK